MDLCCPIILHDVLSFHLVILLFSWVYVFVFFFIIIIIIVSYHAFYVLLSCVSILCCFVLSFACVCFRVLDSFSVVNGPRADIDGMMVMIQSTLRLDFFS